VSTFFFALLCIVVSVAAQFLLKAGMSDPQIKVIFAEPFGVRSAISVLSNLYIIAGFMLYGLGAIAWLGVLLQWEVSKAYPLVGFGFVLTIFIGWLSGEHVNSLRLLGVALICFGIVLVGRS